MNLPDQPQTFSAPPAPEHLWVWRLENASGDEVELDGETGTRFPNKADAESWIGEVWSDLLGRGVDAVTLLEGDRCVYGPMSLHAEA